MNKDELITELSGRNANFSCTESKKNLETKLEEIMHGIQRLPALMYYNPHNDIHQINLQTYEILFTEPLHDISNHIKNLYTELPYHIEKEHRKSLNFIINNSFERKEAKNSGDYRKSLLVVTQWFQENHNKTHMIRDILITLSEAPEIMYLPNNQ